MTLLLCLSLCLISFTGGIAVCWTYARRKILKTEAEMFDLLFARQVDLSPEDAIRRAGV